MAGHFRTVHCFLLSHCAVLLDVLSHYPARGLYWVSSMFHSRDDAQFFESIIIELLPLTKSSGFGPSVQRTFLQAALGLFMRMSFRSGIFLALLLWSPLSFRWQGIVTWNDHTFILEVILDLFWSFSWCFSPPFKVSLCSVWDQFSSCIHIQGGCLNLTMVTGIGNDPFCKQ